MLHSHSSLGVHPWWPPLFARCFLEEARRADIKMVELEHPLQKMYFSSGKVPIFFHLSIYRALRLKYPSDIGGISKDGRITTELGTGSLRHAVGILTLDHFRPVVTSLVLRTAVCWKETLSFFLHMAAVQRPRYFW